MPGGLHWDRWELVGLAGEALFFARMLVQWQATERSGRPVIPTVYWYMSIAGAAIVGVYALHIASIAVLVPQLVGLVLYLRNLQLDGRHRRRDVTRQRLGLDKPGYPWPALSVIVPVHNEEKVLAATLANLTSIQYPGQLEVIAAANGCTDGSAAVARAFSAVRVIESEKSGMSFGKNLGGRAAGGQILVYVDADTTLPPGAYRALAEAAALSGAERFIGTAAGAPDRGGLVVRVCFWIANRATRRKQAHAPGGVMLMDRATFAGIGGFNEALPQGTSTDCIRRGLRAGAAYVFVDAFRAVTSIRRFERTGIISQMLSWRRNHRALAAGRDAEVTARKYEDVR